MQISIRGYQAASDRTSSDIAREIGTSHQRVNYWINNKLPVTVEFHYADDNEMVMDRVFWPEKVIWERT